MRFCCFDIVLIQKNSQCCQSLNQINNVTIYQTSLNQLMLVIKHHLKSYFTGELLARNRLQSSKPLAYFLSSLNKKLNPSIQKAIIAHYIIYHIKFFDPSSYVIDKRSIRQRLLDRSYFNKFVLEIIQRDYYRYKGIKKLPTISWINKQLSKESYQDVIKGFQIHQGAPLDSRIWQQQSRFEDAEISRGKIILNPNTVTSIYFKRLFPVKNSIISGEKGIGKSFSFLIFDYLSKFINQCRIQNPTFSRVSNQFVPLKELQKSQKICYINLRDKINYKEYFQQISIQFSQILSEKQIYQKWNPQNCQEQKIKKNLQSLLEQIQKRSIQKGIKIVGVIDQSNRIFRLFRNLQKIFNDQQEEILRSKSQLEQSDRVNQKIPKKWQQSGSFKALVFFGDLLEMIIGQPKSKFSNIILNSSQDFELKYLQNMNSIVLQKLKISKILNDWRILKKQSIINAQYSQRMQKQSGQIQLYNCYWLQILSLLQSLRIVDTFKDAKKLQKHKLVFFQAFSKENNFQIWKNDVRWLQIRQYLMQLKNSILLSSTDNILLKDSWTKEEEELFVDEIISIKEQIENFRKRSMVTSLKKYFDKITSNIEFKSKKLYINCLKNEALIKKSNGEIGPVFKYQACDIPIDQRYSFISSLGFGYNGIKTNHQNKIKNQQKSRVDNQQENNLQYLIFSSDPETLLEVINKSRLSIKYTTLDFRHIHNLLVTKINFDRNQTYGRMLDNLSYHYLKKKNLFIEISQYLNLHKSQNAPKESKNLLQRYYVFETVPFRGFTKIVRSYKQNKNHNDLLDPSDQEVYDYIPISEEHLRIQFDRLLSSAKKLNKASYLGCYPVIYNKKDEIVGICGNQRTFDCMILRFVGQDTLEINFYDWTMGRIASKKTNYLKQAKKLLSYVPFQGKIVCKILIVATQYNVQDYLKELANQKIGIKCGYYKQQKTLGLVPKDANMSQELQLKQLSEVLLESKKPQSTEISFGFASFERNIIFTLQNQSQDHRIMTQIMQQIYDVESKITQKEIIEYK